MAQPQTAPASVNLTVSWNNDPSSPPTITGGDNGGGNVTIPKKANNKIFFRPAQGQDWTFQSFSLGIEVDVNSGNYPINTTWSINVTPAMVTVTDNDNNDTGGDQTWSYSLVLDAAGRQVKTDPIIINKSGVN